MLAVCRVGVLGLLFLWGCGGGAASGGGPESGGAKEATEPTAEGPAEPSGEGAAKGAKEPGQESAAPDSSGGAAEPASAELSDKDIEGALQSLLGDAELIDNLKLKKAGRSPLKVSGAKLPAKLKVIAGSHEVKVVAEPGSKKDAVLVFTKIEREGDQVKLFYRFDVEGLEGRAKLTLKGGGWELTANSVMKK